MINNKYIFRACPFVNHEAFLEKIVKIASADLSFSELKKVQFQSSTFSLLKI